MSDEEGEQQAQQADHAQQAGQAEQPGSREPPAVAADESLPGSPKAADEAPAGMAVAAMADAATPPAQPTPAPAAAPAMAQTQPQPPQQQPKPPQPQGLAIQSSEDVEAAAAALPPGGPVLFSGRCQWVTPKRVLPGQLQITATQMHFVADLAGGSPAISSWLSGPAGSSGHGGGGNGSASAAQVGEGAEGAAGAAAAAAAAADELQPKRRHRRWQLGGLTEVHHRQAFGFGFGVWLLLAHLGSIQCLRLPSSCRHALLDEAARHSPAPSFFHAPFSNPAALSVRLACCSRYLLQPTALECFMADRASHALFNFPSQQASGFPGFVRAVCRAVHAGLCMVHWPVHCIRQHPACSGCEAIAFACTQSSLSR